MKVALLDANDVYIGMVEVERLTDRHLPQITSCDRPAGEYKWIRDSGNPYGGAFWPIAYLQRLEETRNAAEDEKRRRTARLQRLTDRRERRGR